MPHLPKKKIFVCSTIELFHPHIMPGWRDTIFSRIVQNQQHTFIILTKMPERIDRPMPDNVWLGVSVSGIDGDWKRVDELMNHKATIRFVSLEPFLGLISYPLPKIDWLICGRLTGHGKKYNPKKANIAALVEDCRAANIPLFMKNNLAGTWGKPLIQEYPLT
jgi:protein gp37